MLELDLQHHRLRRIEPEHATDQLVEVLVPRAMDRQQFKLLGKGVVAGADRSGITESAAIPG
jgi:hypothetical protein